MVNQTKPNQISKQTKLSMATAPTAQDEPQGDGCKLAALCHPAPHPTAHENPILAGITRLVISVKNHASSLYLDSTCSHVPAWSSALHSDFPSPGKRSCHSLLPLCLVWGFSPSHPKTLS